MIIKEPVKNIDTNGLEIDIRLTAAEVDFVNGCIRMFLERQKGDVDDPKQKKLQDEVKEGFHLARRQVKP